MEILAGAWLGIPIVSCFLTLIQFCSPPLGLLEILLFSVPISIGLSSFLIYIVSTYFESLNILSIQVTLSLFIILGVQSLYPAYKKLKIRNKLWKGKQKQFF